MSFFKVYKEHFYSYTLTDDNLFEIGKIFVGVLVGICIISKLLFSTPKKLSWAITLLNSTIICLCSVVYLHVKFPVIRDLITTGSSAYELYHEKNNFVVVVCLWFGLANICDILFGLIFYPKYLNILTAWVHHSVYIWMMIIATTGNGFFMTARVFAPAFIFAGIEEVPTFLLALGSMFPSLRTDFGFGISFFLLRIVFHILIFSYAIYSRTDTLTHVLYGLTLTLHLHWFSNWILKYGTKSKNDVKIA